LAEPEAVLGKLARALRPGGWLVVEDHDYISAAPVSAHGAAQHRRTHTARMRMFADAGVDHFFGRKLPALLSELGLTDLGNDGRTWIFEGGSPAARWLRLSMQHLRPRLVANTELTDADIDEMLTLFDDPAWTALSPIFLAAWGRRP
jgi:hypothetical protein